MLLLVLVWKEDRLPGLERRFFFGPCSLCLLNCNQDLDITWSKYRIWGEQGRTRLLMASGLGREM